DGMSNIAQGLERRLVVEGHPWEPLLPPTAVEKFESPDARHDTPTRAPELVDKVGQPRRTAPVRVETVEIERRRFGPVPLSQYLGEVRAETPLDLRESSIRRDGVDSEHNLLTVVERR